MQTKVSLVSVIIPCFNQAQYLPETLNSVLNQTCKNWECIILDDGSLDNTEEVALTWADRDKRFRYFRKENGGPGSARNAGLNKAEGTYIQFLDSDDIIDPEKLEIQLGTLEGTGDLALSICDYFASVERDLSGSHPTRYVPPKFNSTDYLSELITNWEQKLAIPIHCFLFKRDLFIKNRIYFNEGLANHEDWECWMNIFRLKPEVKFIDLKLATYRIHQKGLCTDKKLMKDGYLQAIGMQKRNFAKDAVEFKLLDRKYNLIKFGVNSGNMVFVYLGFPFVMIRRFAGKAYHFIIGK